MNSKMRALRVRALLSAVSIGFLPPVFAQTDVSWLTPSTGSWNVAGNWTGGAVPNNGTPFGVTYNVFIDGGQAGVSNVTLPTSSSFTINNLTISGGDILNFSSGATLNVVGDGTNALISNAGSISINGASTTTLNILTGGTTTINGGGTVVLNSSNARIIGAGTLVNSNNRIHGQGTIGVNASVIVNGGTIASAVAGGILLVDPGAGGLTNNHYLAAEAGTLSLSGNGGGSFLNAGTIQAFNDATVAFSSNANVSGGTLTTAGTGLIALLSSHDATLTSATNLGNLQMINSNNFFLGGIINNVGSITVAGASLSDIEVVGAQTTTLSGGGTIQMANPNSRFIGAGTLINQNNLIHGQGSIGANATAIINDGTIASSVLTGTLFVDPGIGGLTNNSYLSAQAGTLALSGNGTGAFTNTGTIQALNGATVALVGGALVSGGTITSSGTGVILANEASIDSLTHAGNIQVVNGANLFISGAIQNTGSITITGTSITDIELAGGGTVTLGGGGSITMANVNSRIFAAGTLINQNNLIHGRGSIGLNTTAITNNGTIAADVAGSTLFIDVGGAGFVNNAHLVARDGGILTLSGNGAQAYVNTGTLQAMNASTLSFASGATLSGGTLATSGSGVIALAASNDATLSSATNLGNIQMVNSNNFFLGQTINNVGSITLGGTSLSDIEVIAAGTTTLSGAGTVTLANVNSRILGAGTLVNQNNRIAGQGSIGVNDMAMLSSGTVASSLGGMLFLDAGPGNFTNNGYFSAESGTLTLTGNGAGTYLNNGTIAALSGGTVALVGGALVGGGTLSSTGTGVIALPSGADASIDNVTNTGNILMVNSNNFYLSGAINNSGSITLAGGSLSDIEVLAGASATLIGGGTIHFNNVNGRLLGAGTLINTNNTIRGLGQIGVNQLAITNNATIAIDTVGNTTIDPPNVADGFVHNGAFFANAGTTQFTGNGGGVVTGSGTYTISAAAVMSLSSGVVFSGGTISNNGLLAISAGTVNVTQLSGTGTTGISAGTVSTSQIVQNTLTASGSTSRLSVNANGTTAATSKVASLSVTTNARMDLNDNALVVDYTVGTPFPTIRANIITGYAAGAWNGIGINSSAAAANPKTHGLAYAEASEVSIAGSFRGQSFVGDAVLVMYTLLGDANLDRTVDSLDFSRLTGAYGITANADWDQADFDYNGKVNTQDFNHLAGNFGQAMAGPLPGAALGASLGSLVPEPATFALLVMLLPLRRRR